MAEKQEPEFPMSVAVTRHLKRLSLLHLGQHVVLSLPIAFLVNRPTGQLTLIRSSMTQRRRIHSLGPGFLQGHGASVQGRSGGEDVIDDDITDRGVDESARRDDECAGDVLTTFLSA
jgi:hypothetical protein